MDLVAAAGEFHVADVTQESLELVGTRERLAYQNFFERLALFLGTEGPRHDRRLVPVPMPGRHRSHKESPAVILWLPASNHHVLWGALARSYHRGKRFETVT